MAVGPLAGEGEAVCLLLAALLPGILALQVKDQLLLLRTHTARS